MNDFFKMCSAVFGSSVGLDFVGENGRDQISLEPVEGEENTYTGICFSRSWQPITVHEKVVFDGGQSEKVLFCLSSYLDSCMIRTERDKAEYPAAFYAELRIGDDLYTTEDIDRLLKVLWEEGAKKAFSLYIDYNGDTYPVESDVMIYDEMPDTGLTSSMRAFMEHADFTYRCVWDWGSIDGSHFAYKIDHGKWIDVEGLLTADIDWDMIDTMENPEADNCYHQLVCDIVDEPYKGDDKPYYAGYEDTFEELHGIIRKHVPEEDLWNGNKSWEEGEPESLMDCCSWVPDDFRDVRKLVDELNGVFDRKVKEMCCLDSSMYWWDYKTFTWVCICAENDRLVMKACRL